MDKMNEKLYRANIDLVDKNTLLEEDIKILKRRIQHAIEYIENTKEQYNNNIDKELIDLLKGDVIISE